MRLLEGNPGKRLLKDEPAPDQGIPQPPDLSDLAKNAWAKVSVKLDTIGVLTEIDGWGLEQLCENYAEILELSATIKKEGRFQTVTNKNGDTRTVNHPAASQLADAERRFKGMLKQFGLTPSARTRVKANPKRNDCFERYRARRFLA